VSAVASGLRFEVLRFGAVPVSAEVALLELEGRFRGDARRRLGLPRLVAERDRDVLELPPAAALEAMAEPEGDGAPWRASYAVGLELLEQASFALALGRDLLDLPAPDVAGSASDREVRLAREANALRRTADEAREAAAAALASTGAERRGREEAEGQVAEARLARDDLSRRVAGLEDELAAVRRDHAAELVRRDEELQAALAARDVEATLLADERVAETEAEAAEARRALRGARAEAEAARREAERERERAEIAEAAVPRGRVTAYDGEPVEGEPVYDRPTTRIGADGDEALAAAREEAEQAFAPDRDDDVAPDDAAPTAVLEDEHPTTVAEPGALPHDTATHENGTGEAVRVLGGRRDRRTGGGPPAEAVPGSAEIGARHIEPGTTTAYAAPGWLTRAIVVAALVVVILALLVVLRAF
jgi:hypothetical protein